MAATDQSSIDDEEWVTLRDFAEREDGPALPKYEAKYVEDMEMQYVESDVVLVKETGSFGGERMYHVPREVVESISDHLPDA